jgi:hypothetical protein
MKRTVIVGGLLISFIICGCDADTQGESDAGFDSNRDYGSKYTVWRDPSSGLSWIDPPAETNLSWQDAIDFCDQLVLDGKDDWRLPKLDELRSLIRGCPDTESDGRCQVWDGSGYDDLNSEMNKPCSGCEKNEGPHSETGGYYDSALSGISSYYWSYSEDVDRSGYAWNVFFVEGAITSKQADRLFQVRCCRGQ